LGSGDARTESGGGGPKENEQWAHFSTKLPIPAQPDSFLSFEQKERENWVCVDFKLMLLLCNMFFKNTPTYNNINTP
jgi:hypothetical protein